MDLKFTKIAKKVRKCNFTDFRPFSNRLVLYNAMPKYSIWFCQHFGNRTFLRTFLRELWYLEVWSLFFISHLNATSISAPSGNNPIKEIFNFY